MSALGTTTAGGTITGGIVGAGQAEEGQRLEGAKKGGSEIFLAPIDNCAEVGSSYYKNIPVVAIKNLNDAISAIKTFNKTGTAEGLNLCS